LEVAITRLARNAAVSLLDVPDAFAQWSHVPSRLVFEGADQRAPKLSICIPTFRRPDLLVEAVASAIEQDWGEPFEVIVVDNDPESTFAEVLREKLPAVERANFRYYVNAENTGMFGNWNRSIELARADWYTMLHDDDLLERNFASTMMDALARHPEIEGLVCRRRFFVGSEPSAPQSLPKELALRLVRDTPYRGRKVRPFGPHHFFWYCDNPVGLICKKADLIALGGYQPDEYPTSDHYFQLRFAIKHKLYECRDYLIRIRFDQSESARPEIGVRMVIGFYKLRDKMAGTVVPRWWMRASGLIMARRRPYCTPAMVRAIEEGTGTTMPRNRPLLLAAWRALSGGY
jgi:glycosyltransferase involved in cell wall biosynthesis